MKIVFLLLSFFVFSLEYVYSQNISTNRQIYDYDIGDEFHYWEHCTQNLMPWWYISKVTNKYYSTNLDTLFYEFDVKAWTVDASNGNKIINLYNDTLFYVDLDSLVRDSMDTIYTDSNWYNGRIINNITTYYPLFEIRSETYIEGCGYFFYHQISPFFDCWKKFLYYKKGNEVWGTPLSTSREEGTFGTNSVKVYPNPAKNLIFFNRDINHNISGKMQIFNAMGILINLQLELPDDGEVNISDLYPGIYFYKLTDEKSGIQYSGKFIKVE